MKVKADKKEKVVKIGFFFDVKEAKIQRWVRIQIL